MPINPTSCSLKQMQKQWLGVFFIAPSVAVLAIAANAFGLFQMLEWATLDRYFRLRPPEPIEDKIAIVTIDESDIQKIGKWPIPDRVLAKAIDNIKAQQPKAIGLDLYRDLPVPPGSEKLERVFKSTPNLIGVEKQIADRVPPPPILSKLGQVGLADLILDSDGKVRRGLMSIRSDRGKTQLGLAAHLSLIYLESKGISLRVADAKTKQLGLGKALFQPFKRNDGGYINADAGGYQVLLNFRGPIASFHTISFTDVLQNRMAGVGDKTASILRDRIVLIGATGQSLNDLFVTPYSHNLLGASPERTPGVAIHANLISQTLNAAIDGRPLIQVWPEPLEWLWIFFWSGCGATLAAIFPHKRWTLASVLFIGCSLLAGSYLMFLSGWWIPVVAPVLVLLVSAVTNTCYILIENIKLYHKQLEEYSRNLEIKVKERTLELEHKKNQLEEQAIELAAAKEAALAASAAKSSFLANMSHELRTPLNAILGFSQLMVRSQFSEEENREYLEIINRSGEHLLALINDVLEISKIEAGLVELKESQFNLRDLLNSVKEMLNLKAESKGLQLIFDLASDVPQSIKADENKLRQILINLLGNAIKFTEKGSVYLKVKSQKSIPKQNRGNEVKSEVEGKMTLQLEVEDTGLGIAPDELDLLFQSFVQTQTGRQSGQGTGLGLSISRKFVQLMGGDITVSSILGKGTIFSFDIQVALANETVISASQSLRQVVGLESDRTYRILVAEDERENRQLLVKLLTSVGFQVKEASNGEEAIALWENWQPHLIWMSMRMPSIDGYEATKQIKTSDRTQSTIVIALTGSGFEDEQNRIFSVGCNDFVRKPFQEQVIFEKMAQHLDIRYIYEIEKERFTPNKSLKEITHSTANTLQADSFSTPDFSVMPTEWLIQLYDETVKGDDDVIYELIEQIPKSNAALADFLRELVYDYRFEEILELIKSKIPTIEDIETIQTPDRDDNTTTIYPDKSGDFKADILIVDDIPENLRLLSTMLRQQGYKVRSLTEGITALKVAKTNPPDLILLDITMPDMDGYQVCQKLKENPITTKIPVIFISAMNEAENKVKGFEIGGIDYITKPFQIEEVLVRVENHLAINRLQKQLEDRNYLLNKEVKTRLITEESLRRSEAKEREKSEQLAITLQKLTQTQTQLIQQEKMSSLGQMIAGIAHEINNPVNFIYGNLEPLQGYNEDLLKLVKLYQKYYPNPPEEIQTQMEAIDLNFLLEDTKNILQSMQVGIGRILEIVKSLRIFSRLDEAEFKTVNIHEGIDSTLMILEHRLKAQPNQIAIEVIKEYGNLPKVECYAGQLNQLFMNILSNAIDALEDHRNRKSSSAGKPQIKIRTELTNENRFAIYIVDNGIGMNEKVQQRLFDPFFTTKEVGKGTGLGLSISYQIAVDKHGGEIRCISAPAQGAMFVIELPIKQKSVQSSSHI